LKGFHTTTRGSGDKERTCGFQGIHEAVWEFRVGGYQVCEKWLKDRKGTLRVPALPHLFGCTSTGAFHSQIIRYILGEAVQG
jgi:hypothetical protein